MPKPKPDYANQLARQAELAAQAVTLILAPCDLFAAPKRLEELRALLTESAQAHHSLALAVLRDFLPPMERGDLLGISAALDAVARSAALELQQRLRGGAMNCEGLARQAACLRRLPPLLQAQLLHKKEGEALLALCHEMRSQAAAQCSVLAAPCYCCEAFARLAGTLETAVANHV